MIEICVMGEPVAQGRPRFTTAKGHVRAYDPQKSVKQKRLIQSHAVGKVAKLIDVPLRVEIDCYRMIPKRYTKQQRVLIAKKQLMPTQKPDVDNYAKLVKDALNGVIWTDDSLVVEMCVKKHFSENPRTEIRIFEALSEVTSDDK